MALLELAVMRPRQVRYQAALRPDNGSSLDSKRGLVLNPERASTDLPFVSPFSRSRRRAVPKPNAPTGTSIHARARIAGRSVRGPSGCWRSGSRCRLSQNNVEITRRSEAAPFTRLESRLSGATETNGIEVIVPSSWKTSPSNSSQANERTSRCSYSRPGTAPFLTA